MNPTQRSLKVKTFFFFSPHRRGTREEWFPLQFTRLPACLVNLSSRYAEISLEASLSSVSSSPSLNCRKISALHKAPIISAMSKDQTRASVLLVPGCCRRTLSCTLCLIFKAPAGQSTMCVLNHGECDL